MIPGITRAGQRSRILGLLIAARGDWVSLPKITQCAAQYNARIYELRRLGFRIANKVREVDGVRCSWFRLESIPSTTPAKGADPQSEMVTPGKAGSFPEFGELAPERYGVD